MKTKRTKKAAHRFEIFISHATADKRLAEALRNLICDSLRLKAQDVFVSSDGESLKIGGWDYEQIKSAHKFAKAVVAMMTPRSIFSPWVS